MARLGEFGAALKEMTGERDDFVFMAKRFEIVSTISPWLAMKLAAASTGQLAEEDGYAAIVALFSSALGPEQYGRFDQLAVGCEMDELVRLGLAIFDAQTARPTEEPAGSSPGQSETSPSSSSASSPSRASGPLAVSVAPDPPDETPARPEGEILSTPERIARMRPVGELLTG